LSAEILQKYWEKVKYFNDKIHLSLV